MRSSALVRLAFAEGSGPFRGVRRSPAAKHHRHSASLRGAILKARQFLLNLQGEDGSWPTAWQGDAWAASQFVLLHVYLQGGSDGDMGGGSHCVAVADAPQDGRGEFYTLQSRSEEIAHQAAHFIWSRQLPSGGWPRHPDGLADLSTSVAAYFALKVAGHHPGGEPMRRARAAIMRLGGADRSDTATRYLLAMLGQIPYTACLTPAANLPAPLAVIASRQPVLKLARGQGIRELYCEDPARWPVARIVEPSSLPGRAGRCLATTGRNLLQTVYGLLGQRGLRRNEARLRQWASEPAAVHASFEAIAWSLLALDAMGTDRTSEGWQRVHRQLLDRIHADAQLDQAWPKPVDDPLQNTAVVARTVAGSGESWEHAQLDMALDWLVRHGGIELPDVSDPQADQSGCGRLDAKVPVAPPNQAMLLMCLMEKLGRTSACGGAFPPGLRVASEWCRSDSDDEDGPKRGIQQVQRAADYVARVLLRLQNKDGGWGGGWGEFPGIDSAMIGLALCGSSSSSPDATGALLAALAAWGGDCGEATSRAIAYLRRTQRADGSWDSRGGVRYLHGTSWAVQGLVAAGVAADDSTIEAGIDWLLVHQNPGGGWGETPTVSGVACGIETAPRRADAEPTDIFAGPGEGPVTASQTAWALLALLAAGCQTAEAVTRGAQFLLETQEDDGSWHEPHFTLCAQQPGRWCRNPHFATAYPLMALSQWAVALEKASPAARRPALRLAMAEG